MGSRETLVRYSMPLGLHHLIGGDHYAPMPENADPRRLDWTATYYHRADKDAVGFDRTRVGQQRGRAVPLAAARAVGRPRDGAPEPAALVPPRAVGPQAAERPHGVGGDRRRLRAGRARGGASSSGAGRRSQGAIDPERHQAVAARLRRQAEDAAAWRDHCVGYFAGVNGRPAETRVIAAAP